ncbi:hypothetical protein AAZX31_10G265300 [Glycine max]
MINKVAVLLVVLLFIIAALASDPDPVIDFCIAKSPDNSFSCKNSSTATVEDFTYSGIKSPGNFKQTGFSSMAVNSNVFPGFNTLSVSFVATEVAFALEGKIYSGFVDTKNKVFAKVLEKGEVMVFPRGLVHFQMNVGDGPATILGIFGSDIKEELLEKAFGLSSKELSKLKKRFSPS